MYEVGSLTKNGGGRAKAGVVAPSYEWGHKFDCQQECEVIHLLREPLMCIVWGLCMSDDEAEELFHLALLEAVFTLAGSRV